MAQQFDLFRDSQSSQALNDLLDALLERDAGQARRRLERLIEIEPGHGQRAAAECLLAALESPPARRGGGVARLRRMEREWLPAATRLFRHREHRRRFLEPLWRGLVEALADEDFDPEHPECHVSRAHRELGDWREVGQSVRGVAGYQRQPALLAALAEADWNLGERPAALGHWFAMCWLAPAEFARLADAPEFPDQALRAAWQEAREREFEPGEPAMAPQWLPAWMLLHEPGLRQTLRPRGAEDSPGRAFDALLGLPVRGGIDEPSLRLRRELKAVHPGLLRLELKRLQVVMGAAGAAGEAPPAC